MKYLYLLLLVLITFFVLLCIHADTLSNTIFTWNDINKVNDTLKASVNQQDLLQKTLTHTEEACDYVVQHHFDTSFCLIADMQIVPGKNRLFIYSFSEQKIIASALVAHGSCNYAFLSDARFSNEPGCGCTAYGKYRVGSKYNGRFGVAYKLYGLDSSNSNAYKRNIVLHSYNEVPDKEVYPMSICNSLGCIMISNRFLKLLSGKIDASRRPVLLWVLY